MASNTQAPRVHIEDETEIVEVQRKRRVFFFLETTWWETVSREHIGSDLHILTDRQIRAVYINGELRELLTPKKPE